MEPVDKAGREMAWITLTHSMIPLQKSTHLDFFPLCEKVLCQFELVLLLATERIPNDANLNHAKQSDSKMTK